MTRGVAELIWEVSTLFACPTCNVQMIVINSRKALGLPPTIACVVRRIGLGPAHRANPLERQL